MAKRILLPATLLLLAGSMAVALPLCAQGAAPATTPLAYDVIASKPHDPSDGSMRISDSVDAYTASNVGLKSLIQYAYNLQTQDLISDLPGWADSARFDIQSKMDEKTAAALKTLPRRQAIEQRRWMMQSLLLDRFQLRVHHVTKELPIYALVIAKGGFKLSEANPSDTYANGIKAPDGTSRPGMIQTRDGELKAQAIPISGLVDNLSVNIDQIVLDKTGLTGKYDMTLRWSSDEVANAQQDPTNNAAPSLFTALQEQLGLKLESTKSSVDTIVVDHVAQPSENE
jgi:uncharacterized protein (TIGR03435 family)